MRQITATKSDPQFKQRNPLKDIQLNEVSLWPVVFSPNNPEFLKENYVQCYVMSCTRICILGNSK